jgi:hypothetical protein
MNIMKKFPSLKKLRIRLINFCLRSFEPSFEIYLLNLPKIKIPFGSAVGNEWDAYKKKIKHEFNNSRAAFLRQPTISYAMHPNQQDLAKNYLQEMAKNKFAQAKILSRLHDIPLGKPFLCQTFPIASPLSIQHAWYIFLLYKHFNLFVPDSGLKHVFEFGGGYGNFCRLLYSFGYSGEYIILDLPEMHAIQKYFLGLAIPERIKQNLIKFTGLKNKNLKKIQSPSLFFATFSLSEAPLIVRIQMEPHFKNFSYLFISYNRSFGGIDNTEYFKGLLIMLDEHFYIKTIKDPYKTAWYILGKNKQNNITYEN